MILCSEATGDVLESVVSVLRLLDKFLEDGREEEALFLLKELTNLATKISPTYKTPPNGWWSFKRWIKFQVPGGDIRNQAVITYLDQLRGKLQTLLEVQSTC